IVLPLVSIGLFAWSSFLYVGVKARKPAWLLWAAIYLVVIVVAFMTDAIIDTEGSSTMLGLVLLVEAVGGAVHALAIRAGFYAAVAGADERSYDSAERRLESRTLGRKLVADEPAHARQLGVGRPDLDGAFDASLVDLNSAPAKVIASVTGVSTAAAQTIVAAREKAGAFSSVEDLDLLVDLPEADVTRLKDAGVCVPRS
ncbi:MAG: ComEA family DNA-binding protein, partial [Thermoleophilaceae bacterium]